MDRFLLYTAFQFILDILYILYLTIYAYVQKCNPAKNIKMHILTFHISKFLQI